MIGVPANRVFFKMMFRSHGGRGVSERDKPGMYPCSGQKWFGVVWPKVAMEWSRSALWHLLTSPGQHKGLALA